MSAEAQTREAVLNFYQALDDLLLGKGTEAMSSAWHHTEYVTTVHPFGHWARGWQEVWTTWEEIAAVFSHYRGHAGRQEKMGVIHNLQVAVLGEVANCISVYKSKLHLADGEHRLSINCTNVLERKDGVWRVVHHHPDQAPPDFQAAVSRMLASE
jgi:ketosteroid isomerase-like protein